MKQYGLIENGWRFEWDNARRRFGCCYHGRHLITMSEQLCELNEEHIVRDVILHEIAHALVGSGHGHGKVWKQKAIEIGCNGMRCYDTGRTVNVPTAKYVGRCPNGHEYYRHKKPRQGAQSSCNKCTGRRVFDSNYLVTWTLGNS
jgi:predicted SprT family Zn-dependent metalloprotease